MPPEVAGAFVHVPRPPLVPKEPSHAYQRRFVGGGPTWYVDRDFTEHSHEGVHVYRDAHCNEAQLRVHVKSVLGDCELKQFLGPVALVELAYRLLDAAHDIRTSPADPAQQED